MTTHTTTGAAADRTTARPADSGRWLIWTAGLIVAIGAAIATAHGLYRVALAATVPPLIAWLYPLITDGLALVAYAATTRLAAGGRRYAWAVVVLAAGLSGLAQASYLAIGVHTAPTQLRFGVGAWPAVAAAITAHLLYLLAARPGTVQPQPAGRAEVGRLDDRQSRAVGHPTVGQPMAGRLDNGVQPSPVGHRRSGVEVAPVGHVAPEIGRHGDCRLNGTQPPAGAGMPGPARRGIDDPLNRPDGTQSVALPPAATTTDQHIAVVRGSAGVQPVTVQPGRAAVGHHPAGQAAPDRPVQPSDSGHAAPVHSGPAGQADPAPSNPGHPVEQPTGRTTSPLGHPPTSDGRDSPDGTPVDRARTLAVAHQAVAGALPSVRALADTAAVSRGTAATALQQIRDSQTPRRPGLRAVPDEPHIESSR